MNLLEMFRVAYLPLDDRPCNIDFPRALAKIACIELAIASGTDEWGAHFERSAAAVVSYDRWIYGGLVESREKKITPLQAKSKLQKLEKLLNRKDKKRYAFNVLLREAPSAFNEKEEQIAQRIKEASKFSDDKKKQKAILDELPPKAWENYLVIRRRNFDINKQAVQSAKKLGLDSFVIGLDDLSASGLNRKERKALEPLIGHSVNRMILPGTDELGALLLARSILDETKKYPSIFPIYSHSNPDRFELRYEDCSITKLIAEQAALLKSKIVKEEKDADLLLFVHSPHEDQLDLPSNPVPASISSWLERLEKSTASGKLCVLADLRYANGADSTLMRELCHRISLLSLAGYSAWNTTANALGFALAEGAVRWVTEKSGTFDRLSHEALLALRLYEDWFYQSEIRPGIIARFKKENRSRFHLTGEEERQLASEVKNKIQRALQLYFKNDVNRFPDFTVSFPWHRLFDIRFDLRAL